MSEGKTGFGKYQCKLCQLGDGTGDYDDDDDDDDVVFDDDVDDGHKYDDDDDDDVDGDEVTAELERTRCALQSRDEEVEALTREVFIVFVFVLKLVMVFLKCVCITLSTLESAVFASKFENIVKTKVGREQIV